MSSEKEFICQIWSKQHKQNTNLTNGKV